MTYWKVELTMPVIAVIEAETDDEAREKARELVGKGTVALNHVEGVQGSSIGIVTGITVSRIEEGMLTVVKLED